MSQAQTATIAKLPTPLQDALTEWKRILPDEAFRIGDDLQRYKENCLSVVREIPIALVPSAEHEIVEIVKIANKYKIPLYSISTGNNWGYGTAAPVATFSVILDLSKMNRILAMDTDLGLVTIEPGVNQQKLYDYLKEHDLDYFVPTTGAGPYGSILGNALEHGFGLAPQEDHFGAVTSLRAILADGRIYQSAMAESGSPLGGVWKWGIGPYLDGLFGQGNFGIVTSMQIALVKRPEHSEIFLSSVHEGTEISSVLGACRKVVSELGGPVRNFKFINRRQLDLYMGKQNPRALPADLSWLGIGMIHCKRSMIPSIRKEIRRILGSQVSRVNFVNQHRINFLKGVNGYIPGTFGKQLKNQIDRLQTLLDINNGIPKLVDITPDQLDEQGRFNPLRQDMGFFWYAPVLPLKPALLDSMIKMIEKTLVEFGFSPLMRMTTVNDKCAIGVVPIFYKRPEGSAKAYACYQALWKRGAALGCLPYRMNVAGMQELTSQPMVYWDLVAKIKSALDPNAILSPGRYSPQQKAARPEKQIIQTGDKV